MTDAAKRGVLDDFFRTRMKDHPAYDLEITMKDPNQMSYQTKYVPTVPAKFEAGAVKKLAQMTSAHLNQWEFKLM